jgi:hypothetical protein
MSNGKVSSQDMFLQTVPNTSKEGPYMKSRFKLRKKVKGVGQRKGSNIFISWEKAHCEVVYGKQHSLVRVLRARNTLVVGGT